MKNYNDPAFPILPMVDNFRRVVVPVPGLSKMEYFAMELFKVHYPLSKGQMSPIEIIDGCINDAKLFLDHLQAEREFQEKEIEKEAKTISMSKTTGQA